ncbi:MAG: hypothetical protein Q6353_005700 [Candidatus Sigynarchaeum springense]
MIIVYAFGRGNRTGLGMFWRHILATVTSRAHDAARGMSCPYARANSRISKQVPGEARFVAINPFPSTTKTAIFRIAALMSCISSAAVKLYHLFTVGHEGNPSTVAG